jgi:hypothetical protein
MSRHLDTNVHHLSSHAGLDTIESATDLAGADAVGSSAKLATMAPLDDGTDNSPPPVGREVLAGQLERIVLGLDGRSNGVEFAEELSRAKELHERVYPSTRRGGAAGKKGGGKAKSATVASFVTFVVEHSHISSRTVERFCLIGAGLSLETRARLRNTDIAWQTTKLEALAKLSREEQSRLLLEHGDEIGKAPELKVRRATKGDASEAEAPASEPAPPTPAGIDREYKGKSAVDGEWHKIGLSGIEIQFSETVTKDGRVEVRYAVRPRACGGAGT